MAFYLFLLLNGTMFIRPAEIVEDWAALPVYEWLILSCVATSLPAVLAQLKPESLVRHPITFCVVALLPAVFLSHLSHGVWWAARDGSIEFSKIVVYFLLLMGNVTSTARLRTFIGWLLAYISAASLLAILQYHEIIDLPSLGVIHDFEIDPETGLETEVPRICSTGIFNDPNDLAMILVLGMVLAGYFLSDARLRFVAPVWMALEGVFGYGLYLTRSRGGLLALAVAVFVLIQTRWGWRKAIVWGAPGVLAMFVVVGGRQSDIGGAIDGDTGQSRIQLWSMGFAEYRSAPWFGIGYGAYAETVGQVAHNSFLHAFVELGFIGGAAFLGCFWHSFRTLWRLRAMQAWQVKPALIRFRPYLLASLAGFGTSMLSLSRTYVLPTYLMLGTAGAFLSLSQAALPKCDQRCDFKLLRNFAMLSLLFLLVAYGFVRVFVRWSA
jgi:O-antigen ligase